MALLCSNICQGRRCILRVTRTSQLQRELRAILFRINLGQLCTKLDTREGAKIIYMLAKSRDRKSRDISDIAYVKDEHGTILTESGKIKARWNQNVDQLFSAENPRDQLD